MRFMRNKVLFFLVKAAFTLIIALVIWFITKDRVNISYYDCVFTVVVFDLLFMFSSSSDEMMKSFKTAAKYKLQFDVSDEKMKNMLKEGCIITVMVDNKPEKVVLPPNCSKDLANKIVASHFGDDYCIFEKV